MRSVYAKFFEVFNCRGAKQIASNSRHHEHIGATKTGGYSLIRSFSTESEIEFLAEDRFPRLRKLICECSEIDVGTSNHRDARTPGHNFSESLRTPSLFATYPCVNEDETSRSAG